MNKQIFILNGTAGAGKDTFAKMLNEHIPTKHISSITPVKQAAKELGWSGEKTPEYRNFLCEFKKFLNQQGDFIWNYLDKQVENFANDDEHKFLLIDIREPVEIDKAAIRYNARKILISNENAKRSAIAAKLNDADQNVDNCHYNYVIKNDTSMDDFYENTKDFAAYIIGGMTL